jgi:hypothetical protein
MERSANHLTRHIIQQIKWYQKFRKIPDCTFVELEHDFEKFTLDCYAVCGYTKYLIEIGSIGQRECARKITRKKEFLINYVKEHPDYVFIHDTLLSITTYIGDKVIKEFEDSTDSCISQTEKPTDIDLSLNALEEIPFPDHIMPIKSELDSFLEIIKEERLRLPPESVRKTSFRKKLVTMLSWNRKIPQNPSISEGEII